MNAITELINFGHGMTHVPSGIHFPNRKAVIDLIGKNKYYRALKNNEFIFDSELIENDKTLESVKG